MDGDKATLFSPNAIQHHMLVQSAHVWMFLTGKWPYGTINIAWVPTHTQAKHASANGLASNVSPRLLLCWCISA